MQMPSHKGCAQWNGKSLVITVTIACALCLFAGQIPLSTLILFFFNTEITHKIALRAIIQ